MTFTIGTPFARNAGYFRNDDRVSGGGLQEDDVRTCPHCQAVILMRQWRKIESGKLNGGFCQKCNAPVCQTCTPRLLSEGCLPYIQRLERSLDMTVKLKSYLKLAGLEPEPARGFFTGVITSERG